VPDVAGDAVNVLPVPTDVPLQLPKYHFQVPPVPSEPPLSDNVLLWPRQIVEVPLMLLAGTELSRTVKVIVLHTVLLHVPSART
jgi:hypothetical protein